MGYAVHSTKGVAKTENPFQPIAAPAVFVIKFTTSERHH